MAGDMFSVDETVPPRRGRLLAVDVFRGLTLLSMVLVNGHGNAHLRYSLFRSLACEPDIAVM
jgi:predicted acyltransferase